MQGMDGRPRIIVCCRPADPTISQVRKIRCDALPEGCSHCTSVNLECFVTDRVSGRTERRGYLQELEKEKNGMVSRIRDLERLLLENGIEVRPFPYNNGYEPISQSVQEQAADNWTQFGSVWIKDYRTK